MTDEIQSGKPMSALAASLPLATLIACFAIGGVLFDLGADVLVVAMLVAASVAGLQAVRRGFSWEDIQRSTGEKLAAVLPVILILLAVSVIFILLTYAIPKFSELFTSFGQELPLLTRLLVGLSDIMADHALLILAAVAAGVIAVRTWSSSTTGTIAPRCEAPRRRSRWHTRTSDSLNRSYVAATPFEPARSCRCRSSTS